MHMLAAKPGFEDVLPILESTTRLFARAFERIWLARFLHLYDATARARRAALAKAQQRILLSGTLLS